MTHLKKKGGASTPVLSALTHTDTPEKKNNKKRHFLILNVSISSRHFSHTNRYYGNINFPDATHLSV